MIYFPDTVLTRYTYTHEGKGVYGETVNSYEPAGDVLVDFQNETNVEIAQAYGVDLQNLYKAYVDINISLTDNDKFKDDKGNFYHVLGQIKKYPKFHKYQKLHLVRERD